MKLGRFVKVMEKWVFFKLLLQIQQTHLGVRITVAFAQKAVVSYRLFIYNWGSDWPLLRGGQCSKVVVNTGLTVFVYLNPLCKYSYNFNKIL
jgi:hypothetical protein